MTFITTAHAATGAAGAAHQGSMESSLLMILIFAAFIYFLLWRPQSKRAKQHGNLISNLKNGDEILTSGGLTGKISKISDLFISLKVATDVEIQIQKNAISAVLPKGTLKF